jgi:hypothetical protein
MKHIKKFNEEIGGLYKYKPVINNINVNVNIPDSMIEIARENNIPDSKMESLFQQYIEDSIGLSSGTEYQGFSNWCSDSENLMDFETGESFNEGIAEKGVRVKNKNKDINPDRKDNFRKKLGDYVKSMGFKHKQVGDDLEIHSDNEHIAQLMFRNDYITVKKVGNKFGKEFEYNELGKIKSELNNIIK